jgi:NAD(P) transhydrogenase subunit beta
LYNALTGIAVAMDGFALQNFAMVIAGTLVGAAGSLLTLVMARAMNRPVSNVLFGAFGAVEEGPGTIAGSMRSIDVDDAAVMLAYAQKVILAPGYGMAVAQAQHKVKELVDVIGANDVVNPAARRAGSPLQGMPILDVDQAKNVLVFKRGQGKGFAGVENDLFYKDNTRMLYGDAQETVGKLVQALKRIKD